ncbi:MAG TPA: Na+/H+ antiporter NhaA [Galbitalea sp.]
MRILRSERWSALLLIAAGAVGLIVANTAVGPSVIAFSHLHVGPAGFDLSLAHWVTEGLLAIFFFMAAIELKHELVNGELSSVRKAVVPVAAAVGGVIAPALIYLAIAHEQDLAIGWPIPTATDIAFALGVLALAGSRLPSRVRALLLALAVIDDLIAILIIAFFFTSDLEWLPLVCAVPVVIAFALLSRLRVRPWLTTVLVILGIGAWALVALSGIHPTIAGVALGLGMAGTSGHRARRALEPVSNGIVLPVFAFVAALVAIPAVGLAQLSPAFWGIVVALPVGKLIGITAGAAIAIVFTRSRGGTPPIGDVLVVSALGGIGFTVSLLMNQLAWKSAAGLVDEGTIAVIVASIIAAIIGVAATLIRSRSYR